MLQQSETSQAIKFWCGDVCYPVQGSRYFVTIYWMILSFLMLFNVVLTFHFVDCDDYVSK